jgi:hypothetical protein
MLMQLEVAFKLIKIRNSSDSIHIIKLEENDQQLITCDNPVSYNSNAPFDSASILTLPLDKTHLLMLVPSETKQDFNKVYRRNLTGIMSFNQKIISNSERFQNSDKFILGDKTSLNKYLDDKELYEEPLS